MSKKFLGLHNVSIFESVFVSLEKKSLAFLKFELSFDISFVVPLEFHQFDEE